MDKKDNDRNNFEEEFGKDEDIQPIFSDGEAEGKFGRFKNADALYSSYLKLEAEFTRRSQQLKKLRNICAEHGLDGDGQPLKADRAEEASPEGENGAEDKLTKADNLKEEAKQPEAEKSDFAVPDDVKDRIIKEYLDSVVKKKVPLLKGGGIVPAGKQKISSITRAGNLSLQYFKEH